MGQHLVEIDDAMLAAARAELETETVAETIDAALRRVCTARLERIDAALAVLARAPLLDREEAWR